jgi:hypothetical protein
MGLKSIYLGSLLSFSEIVLNPNEGEMSNHLHADGPVTGFRQVSGRSGGYADAGFSVTGRYG